MQSKAAGLLGGAPTVRFRISWTLCAILLAYLASRAFGIAHFTPHNDEVIYTDVAALIASDWEKYKYVFQSGFFWGDYKEPLQHWANSLTVNVFTDPVLSVRLWSLTLALMCLLFVHRFVARVWNENAAHLTAVLMVLSEYYFYFDVIGINEAFLYGLGVPYIYTSYVFLEKRNWIAGLFSLSLLLGILLTKGSGILWAAYAAPLPLLVVLSRRDDPFADRVDLAKSLSVMASQLLAVVLTARWLHGVLIPEQFIRIRDRKLGSRFVHTPEELMSFPVESWIESFAFYWGEVVILEFSIFLVPAFLTVIAALIRLFKSERREFWRYGVLLIIYCATFVPLILVAKIEFVRYFGIGFCFLYAAIGVGLVVLTRDWKERSRRVGIGTLLGLLIVWRFAFSYLPLLQWNQTELSLRETPAGWANGAGIPELIDAVSRLDAGVLVVDNQWGHPGTTLRVYRWRYPQLRVESISMDWLDNPAEKARLLTGQEHPNVYYVVDAWRPGKRLFIDHLLYRRTDLCGDKQIIEKRWRDRVLEETSLIICHANLEADS